MAAEVFILGGKRTAMGEYVGALKDISAIDLGAVAAKARLESTSVAPEEIDHTVIGNALQTSGDAIYGARHVALKAGVPFDRPASDRQPALRQRNSIDHFRRADDPTRRGCHRAGRRNGINVAGAARDSWRAFGIRPGPGQARRQFDGRALLDTYCNTPMAGTAENLARKYEVSREEQDAYALRSQQEAKRASDAGLLCRRDRAGRSQVPERAAIFLRRRPPAARTTLEVWQSCDPLLRRTAL